MIKFKPIYMSGETRKTDSTDYIDFYRAENGMIIEICEIINSYVRYYKVYLNEEDKAARKVLESFTYLNDAKLFCDTWQQTDHEITIQRIARGLYDAAADMDSEDYTETREEEINRLETALAKLNSRNPDDSTLLKALELIYT